MTVDLIIEDPRWDDAGLQPLAQRAVVAALAGIGLDAAAFEVSLLACDDARIAVLNADFRQKGQPTNVLSWPGAERGAAQDGGTPAMPQLPMDMELGDIAIAYDTCMAEASAGAIPFDHHVIHLLIHGTLHLLGYDHIRDGDAALMEGLETEILGKLDIPDPYT